MLGIIGKDVNRFLGPDIIPGLAGMFLFLHFYYGVPGYGWVKMAAGAALISALVFVLSFSSAKAGNGFRSASALILAALSLDFFYRGHLDHGASHMVFDWLTTGPAALNFASFAFGSVWMFSQLDSVIRAERND